MMPTLQVEFALRLSEPLHDFKPNGPRFHRWLPNGIQDAIELLRGPDGIRLIVWFERCGVTSSNGSWIHFDEHKREVVPKVLARQGHVDGGPLFARLWLDVGDAELSALRERMAKHPRTGPPPRPEPSEVERISKHIYRLVFDPLSNFIDTLRVTFGQFWLEPIRPFDSRGRRSIVEYVERELGARQWSEDGTSWERYPGGVSTLTLEARPTSDYRKFLTCDDWRSLGELAARQAKPSLGGQLLSRAVQLFGTEHTSEAFVQAAAGLELVVSEFIEDRKNRGVDVRQMIPRFDNLKDRDQLAFCALLISIDPAKIALALRAIDIRNEVVHEGRILPCELAADARAALQAAVEVGSAVCPSGPVRFVELFSTNNAQAAEHWDAAP
jgi:hypothetical protein